MKFNHLNIGQKFEFDGNVYIKTSPLIASDATTGSNRMIPRYANLTLVNEADSQPEKKATGTSIEHELNAEDVLNAFNNFYATCQQCTNDETSLQNARQQFLQQLQLTEK